MLPNKGALSSDHGMWAAGVGLLSFDSGARLPLAALPLAPQAAADLDSPRARSAAAPAGFRGCQYLLASESQLWHMAYRCGCRPDNQ